MAINDKMDDINNLFKDTKGLGNAPKANPKYIMSSAEEFLKPEVLNAEKGIEQLTGVNPNVAKGMEAYEQGLGRPLTGRERIIYRLNQANNALKNTKVGKAVEGFSKTPYGKEVMANFGKLLGKTGKVAGKGGLALMIGAEALGIGDMVMSDVIAPSIQLGRAIKSEKEINNAIEKTKELISQGYDKKTAWQMANNLPVTGNNKTEVKTTVDKLKQANDDWDVSNPPYINTPEEKAELEMLRNNLAMADNAPAVPSQLPSVEQVSANNINNIPQEVVNIPQQLPTGIPQGVVPEQVMPVEQVAQPQTFEQQLAESIVNSQGQMSQQDIMDRLTEQYNALREASNNHPMYSGQAVQPENPYNVDPRALRFAQTADLVASGLGGTPTRVANMNQVGEQMYNAQMGNQLGRPYAEYQSAMMDRYKNDLMLRAQEINNELELAKQRATTTEAKLGFLQKQQQLQQELAVEMAKLDNAREIANINKQGDLQREYMQQYGENLRTQANLGYREAGATAQMLLALSNIPNPQVQSAYIMSPAIQQRLFGHTLDMNNPNDRNQYEVLTNALRGLQPVLNSNQYSQEQKMGLLQRMANFFDNQQ